MTGTGPRSTGGLSPQFRWYLAGRLVSDFGDRALVVVLPFAAIRTGSGPGGVALVLVASQLPLVVGLWLVGVFGGLLPRQRALVLSDIGRALVQAAVFVLFATGHASLGLLVVTQALVALAAAVSVPVAEAAVADLVPPATRQRANAALGSGRSVVRILAPGVAGLLAVALDVGALFLLDALTFVVSAGIVAVLAFPARGAAPLPGRQVVRAIRSRRWLVQSSVGAAAINALAVAPVLVLGPVVLAREPGGAGAWGLLMTAFGVGATIGGALLLRTAVRRPLRLAFLVAPVVGTFPLALAAGLPVGWLAVAAALTGAQATVFNAMNETARQNNLEDDLRVQGAAFATVLAFGLTPVGLAAAGAAAAVATDSAVLSAAAVFGAAIPLVVLSSAEVRAVAGPAGAAAPAHGLPAPAEHLGRATRRTA
jgi:MFS family permease